MNKIICVHPAVDDKTGVHPFAKKKIYARPAIEILAVNASCLLLSSSQTPWADAKPHKPDVNNNLWEDETDGNDDTANEGTNWAGYQQNMSIW